MAHDPAPVRSSLVVARAAVVGVISTIPLVGPTLGELVGAFIPDVRFRRVERLVEELTDQVAQVSERLDLAYVRREEFAVLFEDAFERATHARNDEKTAAFATFMANSMVVDRPPLVDRQRYLETLDQLRTVHLQILAALASGSGPERAAPPFTVGQAAASAIARVLSRVEGADWPDLRDLEQRGLTRPFGEASIAIATNVRNALLPLGLAFVDFVAAETHASQDMPPGRRQAGTREPRARRLEETAAPSLHLELRYFGDARRLEVANNGVDPVFDVALEFPADAANLVIQGGLPINEIPAGRTVRLVAIKTLGQGRSSFNVHIRARTADDRPVEQDAFVDLLG